MNELEKRKKLDWQQLLAPAALVILYVFFSIFGRRFFSVNAAISILDSVYYVAFMAFGITFVIITGGIDLSLGTNMIMSALLGGFMFSRGVNIWICLVAIIIIASIVGFINGLLVSYLKLPPFIATLGMMMMTQGFGSIITKVQTQNFPSGFAESGIYKRILYKTESGFPTGLFFMLAFFFIAWFLLKKTRFGRYTYAIGSNEEAVRLSGVNVARWKTIVYTICGAFSGIAGIFFAAAYTTIIPGKGNGEEMNAIAAVIIGGTSMSGGTGSMMGTLIGALLMSVLKVGLISINLEAHYQTFFTGLIIVFAVLLDIYRNKKQGN